MTVVSDEVLDAILVMQITLAWAGEGRSTPKRLGWWDTDLISPDGGGDFLARLLPQTHEWASLESVREAAHRTDAKARAKMADPDKMRSLYFLGFELDEQLDDRLAFLKRSGQKPAEALAFPLPLSDDFAADKLVASLKASGATFHTVPNGRELKGKAPAEPNELVKRLAAALLPLADHYPLPFYKWET